MSSRRPIHVRIILRLYDVNLFYSPSEIPADMLFIIRIFLSKLREHIFFLLKNLQMQHQNRKNREKSCQNIRVHQKKPDIHKIKSQKSRVAAEFIHAFGHNFCLVFPRYTCASCPSCKAPPKETPRLPKDP